MPMTDPVGSTLRPTRVVLRRTDLVCDNGHPYRSEEITEPWHFRAVTNLDGFATAFVDLNDEPLKRSITDAIHPRHDQMQYPRRLRGYEAAMDRAPDRAYLAHGRCPVCGIFGLRSMRRAETGIERTLPAATFTAWAAMSDVERRGRVESYVAGFADDPDLR